MKNGSLTNKALVNPLDEETPGPSVFHLLVVDDDRVNRIVVERALQKLGYTSDSVDDGVKALEAVQNNTYDLVLMDCQMPAMDGYESTRMIKSAMPESKRPIIIAMTANVSPSNKEKCLNAGMDDYLTKPVILDVFRETLEKWLNSAS